MENEAEEQQLNMTFTETEKTELKQKFTDNLTKEIVAFLNTDGGTVYIGVNDDGSVCGVANLDESLKKIADMLESQILPDCRSFVELGTKYINQKHIIEIGVQKGDDLYYIKKYGRSSQGCFLRVGSTCRAMTEDQINIVHNKYLDSRVRITEIVGGIKNPTFQYLKLLLTEKGFTINEKTFAENFHLLTKDGSYNKMAELLADKNEVSIKVVRFKGKSKSDGIAMRNEYGEKCLVVAMKQAYDYCADVINEELAKLFIRLNLVEQTGYGIPLVTNRYGETVFEFLDFFLRVTIPFEFELESEDIQDISQGSQKSSQKSSQKIIEMIKQNAQITTQEMADALGISRRAVAKAIAKLQETNCVRRVGSDKGGHWEIITEK